MAFYFPPSRASGVYRMLALANHLARTGWEVTVVTVTEDFYERITRSGDPSLVDAVDPRVRVERVPLPMSHLETDLRRYGWFRGNYPGLHRRVVRRLTTALWCDQYGPWVPGVLARLLQIHRRHPVDVTLATGNPYSAYQAVWALRRTTGVPYVLDSRDSWTLNLFTGEMAFREGHAALTWERRTFADAELITFVNRPLLEWHQEQYPQDAGRMMVVANGYDASGVSALVPGSTGDVPDPTVDVFLSEEAERAYRTLEPDVEDVEDDEDVEDVEVIGDDEDDDPGEVGASDGLGPVHLGYVGTLTANQPHPAVWEGWRRAKDAGRLPGAVVDLYGHLGFFGVSAAVRTLLPLADATQQVTWHGAVEKADIANAYATLDVLVMIVADSPYVTSGKVFEYMSTGKPVLGLYEPDCAVAEVLDDYPLLVRTRSLDPDDVADAFVDAVALARSVTPEQQARARAHATRFERTRQLEPLERRLREIVDRRAGSRASRLTGRR
ncbi:glycosyltransferase [Ornithinimicrobium sp. W1665]|uniref:glycosyltransferase n=1 Tax=Ornithinimicrobium sp. W1665 TaxID=3416666 RepID=UPI003CF8C6E6